MSNSSDGSEDYGVDGYWIEKNDEFTTLYFIQAKYTDNLDQIKAGITDFLNNGSLKDCKLY